MTGDDMAKQFWNCQAAKFAGIDPAIVNIIKLNTLVTYTEAWNQAIDYAIKLIQEPLDKQS